MSKHTPGPWKTERGTVHSGTIATVYGDGEWWEIWSKSAGGLAEANARFIVQACNSHDELLEALAAMLDCYEGVYDMAGPTRHQSDEATRAEGLARAALAKARGEA